MPELPFAMDFPRSRVPRTSCLELLESRIAPATFVVTRLGDSGPGSLRDALDHANQTVNGPDAVDEIVFHSGLHGTIHVGAPLTVTEGVVIKGPGSNRLTLDGGGRERVLEVDESVKGIDLTISKLRITRGSAEGAGGGIEIVNNPAGTLTLESVVLTGNTARPALLGYVGTQIQYETARGGGLYVGSGNIILRDVTVSGNKVMGQNELARSFEDYRGDPGITSELFSSQGGGIYFGEQTVAKLERVHVQHNSASGEKDSSGSFNEGDAAGGGIFSLGMLSITESSIVQNQATGARAANLLEPHHPARTVIDRFEFYGGGNGGQALGGGIYHYGGSFELSDSTVLNNSVSGGLGISLYFQGSDGSGNRPPGGGSDSGGKALGGGLYLYEETAAASVTRTTISGNVARGGKGDAGWKGVAGHLFIDHIDGVAYVGIVEAEWGSDGAAGGAAAGGGIYLTGPLAVADSLITKNKAIAGDGGSGGNGGNGTLRSYESSLANGGNGGNAAAGGDAGGGGIFSSSSIHVEMTSVVGNSAKLGKSGQLGHAGKAGSIVEGGPPVPALPGNDGHLSTEPRGGDVNLDVQGVVITDSRLDLAARSLLWDPAEGGLTLRYAITGGSLLNGESGLVSLFWATGSTLESQLQPVDLSTLTFPLTSGLHSVHVPGDLLVGAPVEATELVLALDANLNQLEIHEDNNRASVHDVTLEREANATGVTSDHTITVIKELLRKSGEDLATISGLQRTAEDQARIMFDDLLKEGVAAQKKLYTAAGDQVIDVFKSKSAGLTRNQILGIRDQIEEAMVSKINELGPYNVSHLDADPAILQVIDLAPSSFAPGTGSRFQALAAADLAVSLYLGPKKSEPAYHLEIPQT